MEDLSYPVEKFSSAAYGLAISPASLQERIGDAFTGELIKAAGQTALPADVAKQFQVYQRTWNAVGDTGGQGQISVWAHALSDDEAMDVAKWIVNTAWELRDKYRGID